MYHIKVTAIEWDLDEQDSNKKESLKISLDSRHIGRVYTLDCHRLDIDEKLSDIITEEAEWLVTQVYYDEVDAVENDVERIDSYLTCPRCQSKCVQVLINNEPEKLWRHIADEFDGCDTETLCGAEEYECTSKECGATFWTGES